MSSSVKAVAASIAACLLIVAAFLVLTAQPADNGTVTAPRPTTMATSPTADPHPAVTDGPSGSTQPAPETAHTQEPKKTGKKHDGNRARPKKPKTEQSKVRYRDCATFPNQRAAKKWWEKNGRSPAMDTNGNGNPCDELRNR